MIFEAVLLFHSPFPLSSKFISSHRKCASRNCASQRHVSSKEFVQPSKAAWCGFALKIPADASLLGNYKLSIYGRLLDWADEKSDRPRTASIDRMAGIAKTVNHLS